MKPLVFLPFLLLAGCNAGDTPVMITPTTTSTSNPLVLYLTKMKAKNTFCYFTVNDVPFLDNYSSDGLLFSSGANLTAYLQKGRNTIGIRYASRGLLFNELADDYEPDASCTHVLSADLPDQSVELTSLHLTVDKDLQPVFNTTPTYPDKHQTTVIKEYETDEWGVVTVKRDIILNEIPEWAWTKATPFRQVEDNLNQLQTAYQQFHDLMSKQDIAGMRQAMDLSLQEEAFADNSSPEIFFASYGLQEDIDKGYKTRKIDWSRFTVKTFAEGKLVQLEDEKKGVSPLSSYKDGRVQFYNPYFAYLDGRFVLAR
jgi:hypothetical protein